MEKKNSGWLCGGMTLTIFLRDHFGCHVENILLGIGLDFIIQSYVCITAFYSMAIMYTHPKLLME